MVSNGVWQSLLSIVALCDGQQAWYRNNVVSYQLPSLWERVSILVLRIHNGMLIAHNTDGM